jgi:hypothetical protein
MALTDVGKEQVKRRATFINGLALIFFSIGVFAPLVSSVYVRQLRRIRHFWLPPLPQFALS